MRNTIETPPRLLLRTREYIEQFKYTEFDRETLLDSDVICIDISDYPKGSILVSDIEPSKEILALYLALLFASEYEAEDLCITLNSMIKRDRKIEARTLLKGKGCTVWEIKLALIKNKLVYIQVKVG